MIWDLIEYALKLIAPARETAWKTISRVSWVASDEGMMREEPPVLDGLWNQIGTLVGTTLQHRERSEQLRALAADHLDAADYTLRRLLGELSAVMPIAPHHFDGLTASSAGEVDTAPLRALLAQVDAQINHSQSGTEGAAAAA